MRFLIRNGVKYEYYNYRGQENKLEENVINEYENIFGIDSIFFKKTRIMTKFGRETIPDGFVLKLERKMWYVIEIELNEHDMYTHIIPQISKFNDSLENPVTRKKLIEFFYDEIQNDDELKSKVEDIVRNDIHKVISDIVNEPPWILIIIDEKKKEFEFYPDYNVIEFKTFCRTVGNETECIHLIGDYDKLLEIEETRAISRLPGSEVFNQIMALVEYVIKDGKDYADALNLVAAERNISPNTVRDKWIRGLGIFTHDFKAKLRTPNEMINFLIENFPDREAEINSRFRNDSEQQ